MTIAEIMAEQNSILEQIKKLEEKLRKEGWGYFQKVVPLLFEEYPGLVQIGFRGWTPSFNDGDPCTHHTEFFIGDSDWGEFDEDEYYDEEGDSYKKVNAISGAETKKISDVLDSFTETLESHYGTGWELVIRKNSDGSLSWNKDYYECGY